MTNMNISLSTSLIAWALIYIKKFSHNLFKAKINVPYKITIIKCNGYNSCISD